MVDPDTLDDLERLARSFLEDQKRIGKEVEILQGRSEAIGACRVELEKLLVRLTGGKDAG